MISLESILSSMGVAQFSQFHFIRPLWLLAVVPMVGFYWFYLRKQGDVSSQWKGVIADDIIEHLTVDKQRSKLVNPNRLFLMFIVLSSIVMAGPAWQRESSPLFEDESSLIIALDVSASMDAKDVQPSRLIRAKQKIDALVKKRGSADTALIVYSGSAHVAMPMSKDQEMLKYFLFALNGGLMPDNESKPESLFSPASKLLENTTAPSTLLVLTDKTNDAAIEEAEALFDQQPHQLVVWAIGEQQGSANGELTQDQLDKMGLLAQAGNGSMVPFTHDDQDIEAVHNKIENNLAAAKDSAQPWKDAGYGLLFLLLPLQLLWFRRGWTLQW